MKLRIRFLPLLSFLTFLLGGCDDPVGIDDPSTSLFDVVEVAQVELTDDVELLALNEAGVALWIVNEDLSSWNGSLRTLPPELDRPIGRMTFLGPDGEILSRHVDRVEGGPSGVSRVSLWVSDEMLEWPGDPGDLVPMGFDEDGVAYVWNRGTDRVEAWSDGEFSVTSLPPGDLVGPEGSIYDHSVEADIQGNPVNGRCTVTVDGVTTLLAEAASGSCVVVAVAGPETNLMRLGLEYLVRVDGEIASTSDFEWEVDLGSDSERPGRGGAFFDINSAGSTVGIFGGPNRVVLLQEGGIVRNLGRMTPADGWLLEVAAGINDRGEILALGRSDRGGRSILILRPRE